MSEEKLRQRLLDLDIDKLVDALLKLASRDSNAADFVEQIIASPEDNIKRFKSKLRGLKRSQKFIDWRESKYLAGELESLLSHLEESLLLPEKGVELLSDFFESDNAIFERCDDSSGWVGDVYRFTASELFVTNAMNCADKNMVVQKLNKLYVKDSYGVRSCLIEKSHLFLPENEMRMLASEFLQEAQKKVDDSYEKRHLLIGAKHLAEQLRDAKLYEKICLQMWPEPSTVTYLDIARIYLAAGDPQMALSRMEKIDDDNHFKADEQNRLLLAIYKELGMQKEMVEIAWKIFREYRNQDSLNDLLSIVGKEKKDQIVQGESSKILDDSSFSTTDAEFLIQLDLVDEADKYLLKHNQQFNGDNYYSLLPLAKGMEHKRKYLSASMLYRALLESILRRAQSKYYHHGIKYLKKLDELSLSINDWKDFISHQEYHAELHKKHYRKSSFWSKYNG